MSAHQKLLEKETINEFLRALGYEISNYDGEREQPDAYVTAVKDGETILFDIEHTDYFSDAAFNKGGSPGARFDSFWRAVEDDFVQIISQKKNPPRIQLLVDLKPGEYGNDNQANQMASELIRFEEESADNKEGKWVSGFNATFPLLRRIVNKIFVQKVSDVGLLPRCHNTSTGNVGVDLKTVAAIIKEKNKKSLKYSWRKESQRLLLISTNTGSITSSAPAPGPNYVQWNDPELQDACEEAPFHCIFIWNRLHSWHKQLKRSERW